MRWRSRPPPSSSGESGRRAPATWHRESRGGRRRLGLPCTVVIPDTAPEAKIAAITRLGAEIVKVSFDDWFEIFRTRTHAGLEGLFIHAVQRSGGDGGERDDRARDPRGPARCRTAVVIPYGGGGLTCGIASALRALAPDCRVYACEVVTGSAARRLACRRRARRRSTTSRASSTASARPRCSPRCSSSPASSSTARSSPASTRSPRRGAPARRASTGRRRGRGRDTGRRRTGRQGRRREGRLRRLGRQYRRVQAGRDPQLR